jgi:hypothetical protein
MVHETSEAGSPTTLAVSNPQTVDRVEHSRRVYSSVGSGDSARRTKLGLLLLLHAVSLASPSGTAAACMQLRRLAAGSACSNSGSSPQRPRAPGGVAAAVPRSLWRGEIDREVCHPRGNARSS